MNNLPQSVQRDVKIEMKIQAKLGNRSYKDIWIGWGWISLDKNGTLTFKKAK